MSASSTSFASTITTATFTTPLSLMIVTWSLLSLKTITSVSLKYGSSLPTQAIKISKKFSSSTKRGGASSRSSTTGDQERSDYAEGECLFIHLSARLIDWKQTLVLGRVAGAESEDPRADYRVTGGKLDIEKAEPGATWRFIERGGTRSRSSTTGDQERSDYAEGECLFIHLSAPLNRLEANAGSGTCSRAESEDPGADYRVTGGKRDIEKAEPGATWRFIERGGARSRSSTTADQERSDYAEGECLFIHHSAPLNRLEANAGSGTCSRCRVGGADYRVTGGKRDIEKAELGATVFPCGWKAIGIQKLRKQSKTMAEKIKTLCNDRKMRAEMVFTTAMADKSNSSKVTQGLVGMDTYSLFKDLDNF
ncbi:hypothetical protein NDU88_004365 [Pleurodeles waltl]|uniref:Uncharacterized protein n=1 Tax=Pleurodeles waltl TaxID=8319 RepID=A0AAV7M6X8_PLEWA|nr:hypothetical protein NDU88_004365 [Pleurodeles waltl]